MFITTNEGRGWMPAGLFLPREVSSPWIWDELLGTDSGEGSPWEGVTDPARVLAEFGLAWGAKANAKLSALVSSGPIDPGLRAQLRDVSTEGNVRPAEEVDLRVFTPDTADRLGLFGTMSALEHVSALTDEQVPGRCIELAVDAHVRVGRAGPVPVEAAEARSVRERILAMVQAANPFRPRGGTTCAMPTTCSRPPCSRVASIPAASASATSGWTAQFLLRDMVFERRCNELVMLLEGEPTRQGLRDAVYAHEQIIEHPCSSRRRPRCPPPTPAAWTVLSPRPEPCPRQELRSPRRAESVARPRVLRFPGGLPTADDAEERTRWLLSGSATLCSTGAEISQRWPWIAASMTPPCTIGHPDGRR